MIRDAQASDCDAITHIYNHYIRHTIITFEEEEVTSSEISKRLNKVQSAGLPWLVVEENNEILGYAYASKWNERSAYRYTVEVSVYLHPQHTGKGLGEALYTMLFQRLKQQGIKVVIGGIAIPNPASVKLHEKFGMKQVAHFHAVGYKFDQWIDVGYWQVQL